MDKIKLDSIDVVAAILTSAYISKTTENLDFNNHETYINHWLNMRGDIIISLKDQIIE